MCNMIGHMFQGIRPFDWLMFALEALVASLILYEVVVSGKRHRAEQRRQSLTNERVLVLSKLMDKGLRIKSTVPDPSGTSDFQIIQRWMDTVQAWADETNSFLASHSSRASAAFLLVTDAGNMDSVVYASGRQFILIAETRAWYQRLIVQLENLRRIMERPEAYSPARVFVPRRMREFTSLIGPDRT
jgi:hypothetical protein